MGRMAADEPYEDIPAKVLEEELALSPDAARRKARQLSRSRSSRRSTGKVIDFADWRRRRS
jgi:hypothetical protein